MDSPVPDNEAPPVDEQDGYDPSEPEPEQPGQELVRREEDESCAFEELAPADPETAPSKPAAGSPGFVEGSCEPNGVAWRMGKLYAEELEEYLVGLHGHGFGPGEERRYWYELATTVAMEDPEASEVCKRLRLIAERWPDERLTFDEVWWGDHGEGSER